MIKRILNNRIFWIFIDVVMCAIMMYLANKMAIRSIMKATPEVFFAVKDMANNISNGVATPQGRLIVEFFMIEAIAYMFIPGLFILIWLHRYLKWLDIRDIKRKHEEEKKAIKLLIPTLATGN